MFLPICRITGAETKYVTIGCRQLTAFSDYTIKGINVQSPAGYPAEDCFFFCK